VLGACLLKCCAESLSFLDVIVSPTESYFVGQSQQYLGSFPTHLDHHQLSLILDILGTPSLDDFYAISSERSREYIRALPFRKKKNFNQLFPKANPLVSIQAVLTSSRFLISLYSGHRFDGEIVGI
jgi:hypothetical protein